MFLYSATPTTVFIFLCVFPSNVPAYAYFFTQLYSDLFEKDKHFTAKANNNKCKKIPNILSFYNNRLIFPKCLGFKLLGLEQSPVV